MEWIVGLIDARAPNMEPIEDLSLAQSPKLTHYSEDDPMEIFVALMVLNLVVLVLAEC